MMAAARGQPRPTVKQRTRDAPEVQDAAIFGWFTRYRIEADAGAYDVHDKPWEG
jgi:hypothetical protein